jgi:hypothetical protein
MVGNWVEPRRLSYCPLDGWKTVEMYHDRAVSLVIDGRQVSTLHILLAGMDERWTIENLSC